MTERWRFSGQAWVHTAAVDVRQCKTLGCGGTFDATAPRDGEVRWCSGTNGLHRHAQRWNGDTWRPVDGTQANGPGRI